MLFNKSLGLAVNNWKVMVKALIIQVFILALTVALCFLLFGSLVEDVISVFTEGGWTEFITETVSSIANATFDGETFAARLSECIEKTQAEIEAIPNMWNRVEFSYLAVIALVLLYRILISISDVAVSFELNEFMTSNSNRMFLWYFFKKFGDSCKFVFMQMLITLPLDLLVILGGTTLCLVFALSLRWWAIIPAVIIVLFLYSVRLAYFAFWLPAVTDEEKVSYGLRRGLATIPYRFWRVFGKTFVILMLMVTFFLLGILYVENTVLKVVVCSVPNLCLFFVLKCVAFVEYYEMNNRPYFFRKVDIEGTERFNKKRERKNKKSA